MLLTKVLKERELLSEELILLEAEIDMRRAVSSALKTETKNLTSAPSMDKLAEKIVDNYINNLRDNKSNNDRYLNDKSGFMNISSKDFPAKDNARYLAILAKNRNLIISYVEKAIKNKLAAPYTNEWIVDVFSNKVSKDYNKNVDVSIKRTPVSTPAPEKIITKKEVSKFKPEVEKKVTKKDFLIEVFDIYLRETKGKSPVIKQGWIQQHLTMELDQKPNNPPRPKCDDVISKNGFDGYEVEYKKVSKKLEKSDDVFSIGASGAILYADIMKVSTFLPKVKEKEEFEDFYMLLKRTFKNEAVKLATSTVRGKKNYLIFATYLKGGKPYSCAAEGSDFIISDRGSPRIGPEGAVPRWELGISRKAKNLVDLPDDLWDKMDKASGDDRLASYIENNATDYSDESQNRVKSGFGIEKFLKKPSSKGVVYDTLKSSKFKEGSVSKNPETKLKFIFKYNGSTLFEGRMEFKFTKNKITPTGDEPSENPRVIAHEFSKVNRRKDGSDELEHDHKVKAENSSNKKSASVDTDIRNMAKELLSLKKGKKNV